MSTQYYVHHKVCACCGRYDELHIGGGAFGWQFSFQYIEGIAASRKDWEQITQSGEIYNEYGEKQNDTEFWLYVESTRGRRNHIDEYPGDGYKDTDGWSFTLSAFS